MFNPVPPSLVFNGDAKLSIVALYNVTSLIPVANVLPWYLAPDTKILLPSDTPEGKLDPMKFNVPDW